MKNKEKKFPPLTIQYHACGYTNGKADSGSHRRVTLGVAIDNQVDVPLFGAAVCPLHAYLVMHHGQVTLHWLYTRMNAVLGHDSAL